MHYILSNIIIIFAGTTSTENELSVFFTQTDSGSAQSMINGNVHLEQKSNLTYKIVVKDSGGKITPAQNITRSYIIYNEAHLLNIKAKLTLNSISSSNPELSSHARLIATNLNSAQSDALRVSILTNQSMGSSVLKPLLNLKSKVNLIERQMQVLLLKHQKANTSIAESNYAAEFQEQVNRLKKSWKVPLERQNTSRIMKVQSLIANGKICLQNLCLWKSELEVFIEASPIVLKEKFGLKTDEKTSTAIKGKANKHVILGGLITLKRDDILLQRVKDAGEKEGYFNASMVIYGREIKTALKYVLRKLEFSAMIFLPDGSKSNISAKADITKVLNENEVVFEIEAQINTDTIFLKKLNYFLQEKVSRISSDVSSRIATLHKGVNISEHQRDAAIKNLVDKKDAHAIKVAELLEVEAAVNRTKVELIQLKSHLVSASKRFDNSVINYTKVIEQCPPRVCVSKCVPGLIKSICYEERYEHVITQKCSLVNRTFHQAELVTEASQRHYITYFPYTVCKTRCPPLTRFFGLFGKRRRREIIDFMERKEIGIVRKKRGIASIALNAVARHVSKTVTTQVLGYLGGISGQIGVQIGAFLPAPFGVIGAILAPIIGSLFGSCDKLCITTLIPILKSYTHYEVVQVWKTIKYKEAFCTDIPIRQKLGFHDERECDRWSNCSEVLTDVECLNHNDRCRTFRSLVNDKIRGEIHLAPVYAAYQRKSLQLEALETRKRRADREKTNAHQSLIAAKSLISKANYTHMQYKKALADAHKLLENEIKLSKLVSGLGRNVISVQKGQFRYLQSSGVQAPRAIYLVMDIAQKDGKYYQVSSVYDFDNSNQSISDAIRQIIEKASSQSLSRKRRATDANQQMKTLMSVDDVSKNASKIKCEEVDKNVLYLIEIAMIVRNGTSQFLQMQKVAKEAQILEERHIQSTMDMVSNSDACTSNVGGVGCSSQWLANMYRNTTLIANSTANSTLLWEAKRSETFAKLQQFTDHRNFTKCGGTVDCVELSIKSIFDMIEFENSNLSKMARTHILEIRSNFSQIFENFSINANETYDLTNNILESIKLSQVRNLFCDPPPVILKDLPQVVVVTQENTSSLILHVDSKHKLFFKWMKNGREIPNQKNTILVLSRNRYDVNGYYNCEISNKFGKVTSNTAKVEYQTKPTITRHPEGLERTLRSPNTTITLICNATGQPKPSITWHHTQFNDSKETIVKGNETMLQINAKNSDQSGVYRCSASNIQGTVTSHGARVHVRSSLVAEFSTGISFVVRLNNNYASNMTLNASTSSEINKAPQRNATNSMGVNTSNVMQPKLPETLMENETIALTDMLSKQMNISKSRIRKIEYSKHTDSRALISFEIKMKNMESIFQKHSDWTMMSEDIVMARKGLLVLPLWLYHLYNNISSSFAIANIQTDVLSDTMESTMNEAKCPVGYSLNSNGFICGKNVIYYAFLLEMSHKNAKIHFRSHKNIILIYR